MGGAAVLASIVNRSSPDRPPVFDLDQCSFLFMSAFDNGGWPLTGKFMTMQIDNKIDSLSNNLWAEMTLMTALVVILLGILWQFL
jgi:hypothetical protein